MLEIPHYTYIIHDFQIKVKTFFQIMTNLIKFCPTGRNGGLSARIDAIQYHFEPIWAHTQQIGVEISWSRPRSKFMKYFAVSVQKCLDKMAKNWYNITMKNLSKNQTKTQSNVFCLQILEHGVHTNAYVFAKTMNKAMAIINRQYSHKNVLSVERLHYG
jgi:hypothetical protein